MGPDQVARLMNLAVSPAADPPRAAAWVDGFLKNSGEVLHHDDDLFGIFDGWLASLSAEVFPNLLPMLRRTFSAFDSSLRRNLGEKAAKTSGPAARPDAFPSTIDLDHDRAAKVLPLVARLLGLETPS